MSKELTAITILVVLLGAAGLARLVRAAPCASWYALALSRTWTKGKPLNCWTCLCGWGALCSSLLLGWRGWTILVLETMIGAGVPALLLDRWSPIPPVDGPPLEDSNG